MWVPFVWTKGLSKPLYPQTWVLAAFLGAPAATPSHLRCPQLNRAFGMHLFPQQSWASWPREEHPMMQGCAHPSPTAFPHSLRAMGFPAFRWGTNEGWACSIKELCMPWRLWALTGSERQACCLHWLWLPPGDQCYP